MYSRCLLACRFMGLLFSTKSHARNARITSATPKMCAGIKKYFASNPLQKEHVLPIHQFEILGTQTYNSAFRANPHLTNLREAWHMASTKKKKRERERHLQDKSREAQCTIFEILNAIKLKILDARVAAKLYGRAASTALKLKRNMNSKCDYE